MLGEECVKIKLGIPEGNAVITLVLRSVAATQSSKRRNPKQIQTPAALNGFGCASRHGYV